MYPEHRSHPLVVITSITQVEGRQSSEQGSEMLLRGSNQASLCGLNQKPPPLPLHPSPSAGAPCSDTWECFSAQTQCERGKEGVGDEEFESCDHASLSLEIQSLIFLARLLFSSVLHSCFGSSCWWKPSGSHCCSILITLMEATCAACSGVQPPCCQHLIPLNLQAGQARTRWQG